MRTFRTPNPLSKTYNTYFGHYILYYALQLSINMKKKKKIFFHTNENDENHKKKGKILGEFANRISNTIKNSINSTKNHCLISFFTFQSTTFTFSRRLIELNHL